jgi:hypothetical protein
MGKTERPNLDAQPTKYERKSSCGAGAARRCCVEVHVPSWLAYWIKFASDSTV